MIRPIATVADPLPLILTAAAFVVGAAVAVAWVIVAVTGPRRALAVPVPAVALVAGLALAGWFTPVGVTVALLLGCSAALVQRRWLAAAGPHGRPASEGEPGPRHEPPGPAWATRLAADHRARRAAPDEPVGPP